jgi:hypothetical protein
MSRRELIEYFIVWSATITSYVIAFMPLLQFLSLVLAIAISLKKLSERKNAKSNI